MPQMRLSAAPISWGVCEVPGWGKQLPASRVLPEMQSIGLTSTELGAPGFLPHDADELSAVLREQVASRQLPLLNAVQSGLFRVLGTGDVAVDEVVLELARSGYTGRYVLEQDIAITAEEPLPGTGPVEDVRACVTYLREKVTSLIGTSL